MGFSTVSFQFLIFLLGITLVYCSDYCIDKCKFNKPCKTKSYVQLTPCSYSCTCDGETTYYTEDSFTKCGTGKKCYQGDCLDEVPDKCQKLYGPDYIGLKNPTNPCVFFCYSKHSPCKQYEENYPDGACCYTYSNQKGECCDGKCVCGKTKSHHKTTPFPHIKTTKHGYTKWTSTSTKKPKTTTKSYHHSGPREVFSEKSYREESRDGTSISVSESSAYSRAAAGDRNSNINYKHTPNGSRKRPGYSGVRAEAYSEAESESRAENSGGRSFSASEASARARAAAGVRNSNLNSRYSTAGSRGSGRGFNSGGSTFNSASSSSSAAAASSAKAFGSNESGTSLGAGGLASNFAGSSSSAAATSFANSQAFGASGAGTNFGANSASLSSASAGAQSFSSSQGFGAF